MRRMVWKKDAIGRKGEGVFLSYTPLHYPPIPLSLSLTGKRWIAPHDQTTSSRNIVHVLAKQRGIDLSIVASWENLADPFTLGEMQKAVLRIHHAIKEKEVVGIIGDYDADGITGVAQLVRFFRRHHIEPTVILPHRQKHGYGVKHSFIHELHQKNVTLLLTVDTGISAASEIAEARKLGMDAIVTDHHTPHGELPDAIIVHPNISPQTNNYKLTTNNLSGSGVVFTLLRALEGNDWEGKEEDVALAAIGTIGDVVPLHGENRAIVRLGLAAMMHGSGRPIFDLARAIRKPDEPLTSTHVGFRIAPRINAAGRLADPMIALEALLSGGENLARLHTLNLERQEATLRMMEIAEKMITGDALLTLRSPMFHPGIIGLIAGKLTEKYGRPSLIACEEGENVVCSLRSIPQYHIAEALARCRAHLSSFGGHAAAAGCTLQKTSWGIFIEALRRDATSRCEGKDFAPEIMVDAILDGEDVTLAEISALAALEPYGAGNPEPRFLLQNQTIGFARCVGSSESHLQCTIGGKKAIGFGLGHLHESLPDHADILCKLGIDRWNGNTRVQLFVEDIADTKAVSCRRSTTLLTSHMKNI